MNRPCNYSHAGYGFYDECGGTAVYEKLHDLSGGNEYRSCRVCVSFITYSIITFPITQCDRMAKNKKNKISLKKCKNLLTNRITLGILYERAWLGYGTNT